jgi:hypothetical protein
MWKRYYYNLLIRAQKLVEAREVGGNRGRGWCDCFDLNGSSRRTANTGGNNNPNIQSRAETAQDLTTYAGCHTNAGKSYLGALIKDLDGELRASLNLKTSFLKTFSTRALTREFAKGARS